MMSKKQWFVLLCLFIVYLLLGAIIFHEVEKDAEKKRLEDERMEKRQIEELLMRATSGHREAAELFDRLTKYCGKPIRIDMSDIEPNKQWDFYHSLFFVITVVSTIGYGNLAPTTMFTRIFMIFYALVGIPINGIVMVTLGDFFGKKFIKLYHRWKTDKYGYTTARIGLISQVIFYLTPGFALLIFVPSILIMIFEGWPYDVSVYYAFVTLTTIGFGDIVAGVKDNGLDGTLFVMYKTFLLIWIIIGLGYVVMVLGFISRGLRSKKVHHIEHLLAHNIKKTPHKIREEFRALLHDFLMTKVKRVYKGQFVYTPRKIERSVSCPELTVYRDENSPLFKRKRAYSEAVHIDYNQRIQSDTELDKIDKERTFEPAKAIMQQTDLLMMVVNALGGYNKDSDEEDSELGGINCFSDEEILASERLENIPQRKRAFSEVQFPFYGADEDTSNLTWSGPFATKQIMEIRNKVRRGRPRKRTFSNQECSTSPSLLTRLRNTFKSASRENVKNIDVERGAAYVAEKPGKMLMPTGKAIVDSESMDYIMATKGGRASMLVESVRPSRSKSRKFSAPESVLENTSIAELFRAITAISTMPNEAGSNGTMRSSSPKRKFGTASLTPPTQISPPRVRRLPIRPVVSRRSSLMPSHAYEAHNRRFSLNPSPLLNKLPDTLALPASPSYTPLPSIGRRSVRAPGSNRRYSLRPVANVSTTPSPVQRQIMRSKDKDDQGQ